MISKEDKVSFDFKEDELDMVDLVESHIIWTSYS
jgi:hypothetical protein